MRHPAPASRSFVLAFRLRALHLDPAALLARARAYEDNATINATKGHRAQQSLDKPRSFTDADMAAARGIQPATFRCVRSVRGG
jgi:hypothetical protein